MTARRQILPLPVLILPKRTGMTVEENTGLEGGIIMCRSSIDNSMFLDRLVSIFFFELRKISSRCNFLLPFNYRLIYLYLIILYSLSQGAPEHSVLGFPHPTTTGHLSKVVDSAGQRASHPTLVSLRCSKKLTLMNYYAYFYCFITDVPSRHLVQAFPGPRSQL